MRAVDDKSRTPMILVLLILLAAGATLAFFFWYVPYRRGRQTVENERMVWRCLKGEDGLAPAERDFHAHDRDGNGVNDFWTADLQGLYRAGLIRRDLAEADADLPKPIPYYGYYYVALKLDESVTPPEPYRQDTDQKSGKVHHREKFAFLAYPADPGVSGIYYLMINENNTVFRARLGAPFPKNWPPDHELKSYWSKPD
jgi:hypothetical protein